MKKIVEKSLKNSRRDDKKKNKNKKKMSTASDDSQSTSTNSADNQSNGLLNGHQPSISGRGSTGDSESGSNSSEPNTNQRSASSSDLNDLSFLKNYSSLRTPSNKNRNTPVLNRKRISVLSGKDIDLVKERNSRKLKLP